MRINLYIQLKNAAAYAASPDDQTRAQYIYPTTFQFPESEWLEVGWVEWISPPMNNATKLVAAEALSAQQRDVRAKAEAECTALEGVKQSLLALTYEGSTL